MRARNFFVLVLGCALGLATVSRGAGFCRFAVNTTMTSCVMVGSVPTDAQGNAHVKLNFPLMGKFDGVFVLTRNDMGTEKSEFVTGFRIL